MVPIIIAILCILLILCIYRFVNYNRVTNLISLTPHTIDSSNNTSAAVYKFDELYDNNIKRYNIGDIPIESDYENKDISMVADSYNICYIREFPWSHPTDATIKLANIKDNLTILDMGAGTGMVAIYICKRFPNVKIDCIVNTSNLFNIIKTNINKYNMGNRISVYMKDFNTILPERSVTAHRGDILPERSVSAHRGDILPDGRSGSAHRGDILPDGRSNGSAHSSNTLLPDGRSNGSAHRRDILPDGRRNGSAHSGDILPDGRSGSAHSGDILPDGRSNGSAHRGNTRLLDELPNSRYDRILFLESIGYAHNRQELIHKCYNMLNPNGQLFIKTPSFNKNLSINKAKELIQIWNYNFSTFESLLNDAKSTGSNNIKCKSFKLFNNLSFINPNDIINGVNFCLKNNIKLIRHEYKYLLHDSCDIVLITHTK